MNDKPEGSCFNPTTTEKREQEIADLLGGVATEILKKPRVRKALFAVLEDAFHPWSQGNFAQRALSGQALKIISNLLNPAHSYQPRIDGKAIGRLITLMAQNANAHFQENPMCLVDYLKDPLCDAIKYIDFGEIKELLDRAEAPVVELVKAIMGFVWNTYPAKLGAVMAFIHPLGNMAVKSVKEIVLPLNGITPDLFADLIFSIVGGIEGKEIGGVANGILELIRQLHTGSLLQGESGVSQCQMDMTKKLRDIFSGIDKQLFTKVKVIASENREERVNAVADIMMENPELVLGLVSKFAAIQNPRIRRTAKKIRVYENLRPDEWGEALSDGMSQIDTQGIAGIFNAVLRLANSVHEQRPEMFSHVFRDIVHAIDEDELHATTRWIFKDIRDAIKPIEGIVSATIQNGVKD